MTTECRIQLKFYRQGDEQALVVAEWAFGPRNLVKAYHKLELRLYFSPQHDKNPAEVSYWLATTDGRVFTDLGEIVGGTQAEMYAKINARLLFSEEPDAVIAASIPRKVWFRP